MNKLIFLLVIIFFFTNYIFSQNNSDLSVSKNAILELMKRQGDSLKQYEKKKIVKLFGLNINNDKTVDSYPFSFGRGGVLRFYLCTTKGQIKLQLIQSNWMDVSKKRIVLFETKNSNKKSEVLYYDYKLQETNDFELTLKAVGDEKVMASVIAVQIVREGNHYFYPKENKVVIINENDTIIEYY